MITAIHQMFLTRALIGIGGLIKIHIMRKYQFSPSDVVSDVAGL